VKETNYDTDNYTDDVKEVIREGVRTSHPRQYVGEIIIDKVIDNRVIETHDDAHNHKDRIDGVIKNGVKETKEMLDWACTDRMLSNILENGVKETKISPTHTEYGDWLDGDERLEEIIKNGVKVTRTPGNGDITSYVDWLKDNKTSGYQGMVEDVIENGVKETVAAGYTDPKTSILHIKWGDQIDDVIDNGVKEVVSYDEHKREPVNTFGYIDDIIKEGVKINGTYAGGQRQSEKCKSVVEYGTKNPTD
jgi:Icc-related predicted phosphoesterase